MGLRLVLATDAIFPPLTGIGRYAYELATRLQLLDEVEELRYLGMWAWGCTPGCLAGASRPSSGPAPIFAAGMARLRRHMATKTWAVEVYDQVSEVWRSRLLRQGKGAVYHSPNYFLPAYDGPLVATVHDLSIHRFPETHPVARRRYFDLAFRRSLDRADALITDSEAVRQELISDYSVAPQRVTAIHLGVDVSFRPHTLAELQPVLARYGLVHGQYVLSVGTLEPRKRLDQLITAYAGLPAQLRARFPLILTGSSGWLNERLRPLIERGQAEGWLRYIGFVPQVDLPAIYAGAHAFAMISIYEGFGLPLLEAMASGVPVMTSDRSCMPEVTAGAALLVDPDDVEDIRGNLVRLLEDSAWRAVAMASGLTHAHVLTWERCLSQTTDVYRSVA